MKRIKLSRAPANLNDGTTKRRSKFEQTIDARRRIQLALDELNTINSKSEIADALARGTAFSHEEIQRRIHVGTDTLRITNSDLFDNLKERLLELERIWGGPLRGMAAKGGAKPKRHQRKTTKVDPDDDHPALAKLRAENDLLNKMLANAQEEILDLTTRLSVALHLSEK